MAKISWAGKSCFQISVSSGKDNSAEIVIDKDLQIKGEKGEKPFVIDGPGEYEVKGVFVQGIAENKKNTIYLIEAEDIKFCHLGDLSQKQLTDEQLEKIDTVDILMVSANDDAQKIIQQIEPKMVIPMAYEDVSKFLKAMGKTVAPIDKLTVKDSTLPKEGAMEIVVLQP